MRHAHTEFQTDEVEILDSLECDICHTNYDDMMDVQEFIKINYVGGFRSIFGDGNRLQIDICQHCFKRILLNENLNIEEFITEDEDWF